MNWRQYELKTSVVPIVVHEDCEVLSGHFLRTILDCVSMKKRNDFM